MATDRCKMKEHHRWATPKIGSLFQHFKYWIILYLLYQLTELMIFEIPMLYVVSVKNHTYS